ncbi:MAG: hypothetical protein K1X92_16060 [Bacteroidia bacterium]|nr:hypothetical protein [Bacteroidia bacterium]
MSKLFSFFLFLFVPVLAFCQQEYKPEIAFTTSYYGETLTHPGVNAGIEYYPFQAPRFQTILAANLGGYLHIRNNTSLFFRGQWGQRAICKNGFFVESFLGLGYLHHFTHGGKTFDVLPNGAVVKVPNTGKSMVMPGVSIGLGYDFSKKTNCNIRFFLRPELFWKAPFNGYYLTHFALNTGLIFQLAKK